MSKFARTPTPAPKVRTVSSTPDTKTEEGGAGYSRDPQSELFLLAVTNMVSEKQFYESAQARDSRFEALAKQVIDEDPKWVAGFIPALRQRLNMRSASIVLAALYARARLANAEKEAPSIRQVIDSALVRADEPSELLAFWTSRWGRTIPKPVKRGVADAIERLYTERNFLKWDSDRSTMRFGDVIELTHPKPVAPWQSSLFRYAIDDRHGRALEIYEGLETIRRRRLLEDLPVDQRRPQLDHKWDDHAKQAAITWEWLSGWLQGKMDAKAWEAVIPQMGYMALLRNLRNFEQAGVSDEVKAQIKRRLEDPEEVAKSRQLPLRFYNAYKNVGQEWDGVLEQALQHTLINIPMFSGKTLVMVDGSASMGHRLTGKGKAQNWEVAALFGGALALRSEDADLYLYNWSSSKVETSGAESVLAIVKAMENFVGGGTNTWGSTESMFAARKGGYDRVVIITDEQSHDRETGLIPSSTPIYVFNVVGYRVGTSPSWGEGRRYTFGGLTDAGFAGIAALEMGVGDIIRVAEVAKTA